MEVAATCIGCGSCVVYCPMAAITIVNEKAKIDQDECVECMVCLRSATCPTDSLIEPYLTWPRSLRRSFSDPADRGEKLTYGRGTMEMKANDVMGSYHLGEAGICIDVGRPGIGTRLRDVQKIYRRLVKLNVKFDEKNPIRNLLHNEAEGTFKEEVLNEKVMSIIIELKVPSYRLPELLRVLEQCSSEVDTVFSVGLIDKVADNGSMGNYECAKRSGYLPSVNAKVNIGVGRPLAKF